MEIILDLNDRKCIAIFPTKTTVLQTITLSKDSIPCVSEVPNGEHSEETEMLKYMRDSIFNQTPQYPDIIRVYYLWNPVLLKAME